MSILEEQGFSEKSASQYTLTESVLREFENSDLKAISKKYDDKKKAQLEYNKFRYYLRKFDMPIKIRLEDERVHLYKEWSNN